ncbi:MAG: sulfurtransferase TusA family protein [Psychrilyobacter sp.]|uniref:sulfurtransferase TusA family protein n=1 Tax=Psychrilyobacter sp. TaxID=2586924 RepID=UPI003C778EA7
MMTIDVRGLSCPIPVLKTKQAVKNKEKNFEIISDSNASMENILKYLRSEEYTFIVTEVEDDYVIKAKG